MISGYATPAGTQPSVNLTYNSLGNTDLRVSGAGFGCYRVNTGVVSHENALEMALTSGINLIDTSANYADGESEKLVGAVLEGLVETGRLAREQVVIITKGGYLQGSNFAESQARKKEGKPFIDLVEYADGLEHCIHPDFLDDQITRSLDRLGLETIDGYLLHNPEYYLGWAHKHDLSLERARGEYYRRIESAFRHLETEVEHGRVRYYGVSSNTFIAASDDPEFTALDRIWEIAESIDADHHFRIIQFPLNLLEPGAVLEKNQSTGKTLLEVAIEKRLGVLINRPLNAFTGNRMVRLADVEVRSRMDLREIIDAIKDLAQSEAWLWRKILPRIDDIPMGLRARIKQQVCIAETLKHHWRNFGSLEHWRQTKDGNFLPRIQGVMDFLYAHTANYPDLAKWMPAYEKVLAHAWRAIASVYAEDAVVLENRILNMVALADDTWARPGTLSQKAIRSLLSTRGISSVLVGMRRNAYVSDVVAQLDHPVDQADRHASWMRLRNGAREVLST